MDDNRKLHLLNFGPEADHALLATDLRLDSSRVAAVKRRFEIQDPNQAENEFMGCVRGFAQTAAGIGTELGADRVFRFGKTYDGWPWPSNDQLRRMVPTGRLRHRFGQRS